MSSGQDGKKHPLEWATFVFLVLTFGATAGAAVFTGLSWTTAKDQKIRQTRAYVFLKDISLKKRNEENYDLIPEWENGGNSETNNMRSYVSRYIGGYPLPVGFSFGDLRTGIEGPPSPIILGPKDITDADFGVIAGSCLRQFNQRYKFANFFIWGWTTYHDTLTTKLHTTRFCWIVDQVNFTPDGSSARLSHYLCNESNCADDECPAPPPKQLLELPIEKCEEPQRPPPAPGANP